MNYMKFVKMFSVALMSFASVLVMAQDQPLEELGQMIRVDGKSFLMGIDNATKLFGKPDEPKQVTVTNFWMDKYEVSNNQYRKFVHWVRDSIAMQLIADADNDHKFAQKDANGDVIEKADGHVRLEWKNQSSLAKEVYKSRNGSGEDGDYAEALADLFAEEGTGSLRTEMLHYRYEWNNINYTYLTKHVRSTTVAVDTFWVVMDEEGKATGEIARETKIYDKKDPLSKITKCIINVYPDTMVWVKDFPNSRFGVEEYYFWSPDYGEYPVVGVTWEQAHAYCDWRTKEEGRISGKKINAYRLPSEAEWEHGARAGLRLAKYPWGNEYRASNGRYMANAKNYGGIYIEDKYAVPCKVSEFEPHGGLYNMAGNVAEWTATSFSNTSSRKTHDFNPDFSYMANESDPKELKLKVVKGGSWKDISYFLQCGVRTKEYQDEARSYIGFRCVRTCVDLTVPDGDNM